MPDHSLHPGQRRTLVSPALRHLDRAPHRRARSSASMPAPSSDLPVRTRCRSVAPRQGSSRPGQRPDIDVDTPTPSGSAPKSCASAAQRRQALRMLLDITWGVHEQHDSDPRQSFAVVRRTRRTPSSTIPSCCWRDGATRKGGAAAASRACMWSSICPARPPRRFAPGSRG